MRREEKERSQGRKRELTFTAVPEGEMETHTKMPSWWKMKTSKEKIDGGEEVRGEEMRK